MNRKRFCILQVTPESPNPDHVKMFADKDESDFYFVTHDAPHDDALAFCPNTTWTDTRNTLAAMVPKQYDYYAFVDYDYNFQPLRHLDADAQILEDLNEYNPAVLTYYPGSGMITPFATNFAYRDSLDSSILPFSHCGMKVVHHTLMDWFFPMVTRFGGGVEACHLFNILETPFLGNVVCSHKMIYHNGNTDTEAPHNVDGAYNKYCMDQMWSWILPAWKKRGVLKFYAPTPDAIKDSLSIKEAFIKIFMSKTVKPATENSDVDYWDIERVTKFFDLSHERFINQKVPLNIILQGPSTDSKDIAKEHLRTVDFKTLRTLTNPWPSITRDINNKIQNGCKLLPNECVEVFQTMEDNKNLFIDNCRIDEQFADLVSGKRVAYVGPSPYLMNSGNGSKIDDYDIVVRIQGAIFEPEDYGSKTHIIQSCMNANYGPALEKYLSELSPGDYPKYLMCNDTNARPLPDGRWGTVLAEYDSYLKKYGIPITHLKNEDDTWDRWALYWELYAKSYVEKFAGIGYTVNSANFNSGYGALNVLCRYPLEELYVTGIDFYNIGIPQSAAEKYNPIYIEKFGKEGTPYGPDKTLHDQLGQITHFKNVLLNNRGNIVLDKYLQDKLDSDELTERINKYQKLPKFKHETS